MSAHNGFPRSIGGSSLFVLGFLVGLGANNWSLRSIIPSTCELGHKHWMGIHPTQIIPSRVSLSLDTVVAGEVDELEEDVG